MKNLCIIPTILAVFSLCSEEATIHSHNDLKLHTMYGNSYRGLATKETGAKEFEVWRASLAVGSKSPKHIHETEEVFIVLKGHILAIVGDKEYHCIAPSTLICPANVPHQLINVGDVPSDQILILGIDSKISDLEGTALNLPWR
jgi:quercetin dioxygenase-like cupin family protein